MMDEVVGCPPVEVTSREKEFLVVPLWEVASGTQFLGYCDLGCGCWGAQTRPRAVSPPELFYSCPDVPNPPGGHRSPPRSPPSPLELWGPLGWWPLVPGSLRPPSGGPRPGAGGRFSPWGHPPPSAGSWREEEEEEEEESHGMGGVAKAEHSANHRARSSASIAVHPSLSVALEHEPLHGWGCPS